MNYKAILKSNNNAATEASKHTDAISGLMPMDRTSPQTQAAASSANTGKHSMEKTSKMALWDVDLKRGEEAREKLQLQYQEWMTRHEQERATLVRERGNWIEERLEAEKARDQAQAMITQLDEKIEDKDKECANYVSTHQKLVKDLCIVMAHLAVSR